MRTLTPRERRALSARVRSGKFLQARRTNEIWRVELDGSEVDVVFDPLRSRIVCFLPKGQDEEEDMRSRTRLIQGQLGETYLAFRCPACGETHAPRVSGPGTHWTWDGDRENPTLAPSIKSTCRQGPTDDEADRILRGEAVHLPETVCHVTVTGGMVDVHNDSTRQAGARLPIQESSW